MKTLNREIHKLLGYGLSQSQLNAFEWYEKELLAWNERFNLTAIREAEAIHTKHFLDSLSCALALNGNRTGALIDIGTGAGFPGIPLKILLPHIQLTLVESIGKKADFCRHVVTSLGFEDVQVLQNRAEEIGQDDNHREKYNWAVARAVANLNILAEYLLPLVQVGGIMIAQKGEGGPMEAQQAEKALRLLGGHIKSVRRVEIPGIAEERFLIIIEKLAATPPQYPRRTGTPAKKPLT